ncbi:MAG: glycosyltransferase [Akkermansiaceae bacterium]
MINTVDRGNDLRLTLEAMRKSWDADQDELIVVLGPTGDDSEEVIHRSTLPCRLIHCAERNLAISRNLGWQAANGRHVAFIDDDASPAEGWLDSLLEPLEHDSQTGVSAGFVLDGEGRRFLNQYVVADRLGGATWFEDAPAARAKIEELGSNRAFLTATGCNMAFRRSVLDQIGGFDPFYRYFLEETDAVLRALSEGFRCVAAPSSRVFHRLGGNLARNPTFELENRTVVIRSQIHYIGKFGKSAFSPAEIESCLWQRALLDLEKIAWDCVPTGHPVDLQVRYLQAIAGEFRLDSSLKTSSVSAHSPITISAN